MKKTKLNYNIVRYKSNYAMIDVETFNDVKKGQRVFPYDISIAILNNKHEIIDFYCLLLEDVIVKPLFQESCYYKDKLPLYFSELSNKKTRKQIKFFVGTAYEIVKRLNDIINKYDIKLIKGYNIGFDYSAINNLYDSVNNSIRIQKKWHNEIDIDYSTIQPLIHNEFKKVNCFDLMYAYTTLLQNNLSLRLEYERYCIENNYLTEKGACISSKEDTMYKFFINSDQTEWHLGFKDVIDEIELDKQLRHYVKTRHLKSDCLTLNTKVSSCVYKNNGLYTLTRINKELEKFSNI